MMIQWNYQITKNSHAKEISLGYKRNVYNQDYCGVMENAAGSAVSTTNAFGQTTMEFPI